MVCTGAWAADADSLVTVRYDFTQPLGSEWKYVHEPVRDNYVIHDGMLRLYASFTSLKDDGQPTFVALKPDSADFSLTMKIAHIDFLEGDEVGLAVYQAPMGHAHCCIYNLRGDRRIRVRVVLKNMTVMLSDRSLGIVPETWIRVEARGGLYHFSYSVDGQHYKKLESVDASLLRPVVVGQGNGILVGPYSYMGNPKLQSGRSFVDIDELIFIHQLN